MILAVGKIIFRNQNKDSQQVVNFAYALTTCFVVVE